MMDGSPRADKVSEIERRGACAPVFRPARRDSACLTYGAGLAAGAASAGLAAAAGLASADAEASGAAVEVSSDLLQAAAKKNEIRTRIRTLRIAFLLETSALPVAQKESGNGARILYEKSNFKRAAAL
jgi:hypothetical protein